MFGKDSELLGVIITPAAILTSNPALVSFRRRPVSKMADDANPHIEGHALVGSWFLGPQAENFDLLDGLFSKVLQGQKQARRMFYPQDGTFITDGMKDLEPYKTSVRRLETNVDELSGELARHSIPFWSPRYNGHMNMDTTIASIIGCRLSMGPCFLRPCV